MKISLKFGLWFFVCILIIETTSMVYLHRHVIHSRAMQELNSLKERGNSHRDVLEISSDPSTLHHIALMESKTDTEVVIKKENGKIAISSGPIDPSIKKIINQPLSMVPRNGLILQSDLNDEKYIATVSPVNGGNESRGYVYMFKSTDQVQTLISQLNKHFILASLLILFFMLITVFFLSRALTKPLIVMKEATKKLSNGDFSVSLPNMSKDEIGELSRSIQTLANDLNHLKKERNEFLASVSHELRTPLTYIKGYSDIGRRPSLEEKERIQYFDIIHEESEHLGHLVKELFDLARLDQNSFTIDKERVHIASYLQAIYERVLPAFKEKGIQLKLDCADDLFFSIDPKRFDQVLLNLLDNALKYSNENTTTQIKVAKKDESIHIIIKDEGIGIPKEDLPYIFERLYRVEKSRSRATGGFGLGLAIVKEIVEAHRGNISVESIVGEGTCFKIVLKEQ
ncbi:HAMP domain-containing histidine kinase [Bacillus sp. sid0103]|uniref:sensor histidine kinase n=1 Tax=Bacillus sp. sid0103 TaxID=2856337 RepID=UPI001C46D2E7|nr:HAMP domain-containing sensor histidine kinase [Bacillus sp. sid0103]MBV7505295.1 HAMP domain-containing histidine kinase [Bacillus sp. sid0103]